MGRPVIPIEQCDTVGTRGDIILADMSQYLVADKGGVQSASSIHISFLLDETAFRFVYRVDGMPLWNAPLTPFLGANTLSPFVTLITRV
jgi:HK97 family phage major capsid protein